MKTLLMIISLVSITTITFAQGQRPPRPEPPSTEEMIKKATEELNLTDAQVIQWKEIHEKYEASMEDRRKAKAVREEMGNELEATLTEEQLEKFREMRGRRRPPRGGN